jgi:phenylacetate-coenzyme A ligase PaaK-like adenylate-forming protein
LPLLTREIIQNEKYQLCSDLSNLSNWQRIKTSGSTGEPVEIFLDFRYTLAEATLFTLHVDRCLGSAKWRSHKAFHLTLHAGSGSVTNPALWHDSGRVIKWNLLRLWQLTDAEFISRLACIDGAVITTMPSVMEVLCTRLLKSTSSSKHIQPVLAILSGEPVTKAIRQLIKTTFNCPVTSLYTLSEAGIVGSEAGDVAEAEQPIYQVEEQSVLLEIVNAEGKQLPRGVSGDIVITALNNLAMPLIRYKTGDRGYWIDQNRANPTFKLLNTRQPQYLRTTTGAVVNMVRFAKLLNALSLKQYYLSQESNGSIVVHYSASQALNHGNAILIKSALWSALGPDTKIQLRRIEQFDSLKSSTAPTITEHFGPHAIISVIDDSNMEGLATWLHQQLSNIDGIQAAVLTGSWIDASAVTRFSDIDLVVLGDFSPLYFPTLLDLSRDLKTRIPKLAINFDSLYSLQQRAPLLVCRLLCEQIVVFGKLDATNLPWPSIHDLHSQATYWVQDAIAIIWSKLLVLNRESVEPIHDAWMAAKFILDGLRYRYLLAGAHETSSRFLLTKLISDKGISTDWKTQFLELIYVAREHQPPPLNSLKVSEQYLQLALSGLYRIQQDLNESTLLT